MRVPDSGPVSSVALVVMRRPQPKSYGPARGSNAIQILGLSRVALSPCRPVGVVRLLSPSGVSTLHGRKTAAVGGCRRGLRPFLARQQGGRRLPRRSARHAAAGGSNRRAQCTKFLAKGYGSFSGEPRATALGSHPTRFFSWKGRMRPEGAIHDQAEAKRACGDTWISTRASNRQPHRNAVARAGIGHQWARSVEHITAA